MPELQILNCPISPKIDLNQEWSRSDVTTQRVIQLLVKNNNAFNKMREYKHGVKRFTGQLISDGRAFMSKVFKIRVQFTNGYSYSCVLKVSQHMQWGKYADNKGEGVIDERGVDENHNECLLREKQKEMLGIGERYHNIECLFYTHFPHIHKCPIAKTFYVEPIDEKRNGLLIMENLADNATPLSFYQSATIGQLFSVAKCAARLHSGMDRPELQPIWSSLTGHVYLDLFVDEFQVTGFPLLKVYPEIVELLDDVKPVFDRQFCYYSLIDKPKEYNAFLCCHGDFQPNNILFRKSKNGQLTDKIAAIIDWQLIFGGNPFTDLVRFLVAAVDDNLRSQGADLQAFNVYYNELERLYAKVGQTPGFTREQAIELFELSIIEQTGTFIVLMPFVEQRKGAFNLDENSTNLFVRRIVDATRRIRPLVQKYKLNERFGQKVDWRSLMNKNV